MKCFLLCFAICAFYTNAGSSDAEPKSIGDWKKQLSSTKYKIGKSRAEVETQLDRPIVAEFMKDHGFDTLCDVYYRLDSSFFVKIAYGRAKDQNSAKVVVAPQVYKAETSLLEWLNDKKGSIPQATVSP